MNWQQILSRLQPAIRAIGGILPSTGLEAIAHGKPDATAKELLASIPEWGKVGDEQAVQALIGASRQKNPHLRRASLKALGKIHNVAAIPALTQALQDKDVEVRTAAAQALGRIGDASAVPALTRALDDKNSDVEIAAVQALGEIADTSAVPDLARILEYRWRSTMHMEAAKSLIKIGDVATLGKALQSEDWDLREAVAKALVELGGPSALAVLKKALHDADHEVRSKAAQALGQIKDALAVPALVDALEDSNSLVRIVALDALANMDDEAAIRGLVQGLRNHSWDLRRRAASALGKRQSSEAMGALGDALQDEIRLVRLSAAKKHLAILVMFPPYRLFSRPCKMRIGRCARQPVKPYAGLNRNLSQEVRHNNELGRQRTEGE